MAKERIRNKCELCRREGTKLYLKGSRCESPKCSFTRRDYPPGVHPFRRRKISEYGVRLREKQRCKRRFGVRERQFRRYFSLAELEEVTGPMGLPIERDLWFKPKTLEEIAPELFTTPEKGGDEQ